MIAASSGSPTIVFAVFRSRSVCPPRLVLAALRGRSAALNFTLPNCDMRLLHAAALRSRWLRIHKVPSPPGLTTPGCPAHLILFFPLEQTLHRRPQIGGVSTRNKALQAPGRAGKVSALTGNETF